MAAWQGRTALIFSGAPQDNLTYIHDILERLDQPLIICADRGVDYALACGLKPDLYVGDSDSRAPQALDCERIDLIPEKDDTDTMHALNIAIDRGCKNVVLVCATGGRIDHMLANLALCEYCSGFGVSCEIADARNLVRYGEEKTVILHRDEHFRYFSIIPLDENLQNVRITGAKYPLEGTAVSRCNILTISNEFVCDTVTISVGEGRWLLVQSTD